MPRTPPRPRRKGPESSSSQAQTIHRESFLFLTHIDLPWRLSAQMGAPRKGRPHADLPRLRQGGVGAAVMVIYTPTRPPPGGPLAWGLRLADIAHNLVEGSRGRACLAGSAAEIRRARRQGRVAVLLAIENGSALGGDIANLRIYHRLGVRLFGLTWNGKNDLAGGVGSRAGLSRFGKAVIREATRLGMLIDVSHLGDPAFRDVARFLKGPFIASHSNARALCNHPRNLTDAQIREVASRGGVIGLNFYPRFLRKSGRASIDDVFAHIDHLVDVGGIEAVGLGTDFDGVTSLPKGIDHAGHLPRITAGLLARGYSRPNLRKILGGNFLRVLEEARG